MKTGRISRGLSGLLAGFVAVFVLMSALWVMPLAMADSRGLIITQDSDDNINVTIDPSLISDVQIKRNDGKMTIELMDDRLTDTAKPADVVVDSPLKRSQTVQVQQSGKRRTVTINSSKVFLSIQELSEVTLDGAKTELSKPEAIVIKKPEPAPASAKVTTAKVATKEVPPPPPKKETPKAVEAKKPEPKPEPKPVAKPEPVVAKVTPVKAPEKKSGISLGLMKNQLKMDILKHVGFVRRTRCSPYSLRYQKSNIVFAVLVNEYGEQIL